MTVERKQTVDSTSANVMSDLLGLYCFFSTVAVYMANKVVLAITDG